MARLLLVEDDVTILDVLRLAFSRRGWEVHVATTADEALAMFAQAAPDVVLTDKNLPGGSIIAAQAGVELVRAIRERDRAVGIVLMTAYGTAESARDTLNLGIDEYLEKPFGDLFALVERMGALADRVARRRAQPAPRKGEPLAVVIAAVAERAQRIAKVLAHSGAHLAFVDKTDDITSAAKGEHADVVILDGGSFPEEITCVVAGLKARARTAANIVLSQNLTLADMRRLIELEVRALIDEPLDGEACADQLRAILLRLARYR
jgi:DNA-binding response OmpR family regulator